MTLLLKYYMFDLDEDPYETTNIYDSDDEDIVTVKVKITSFFFFLFLDLDIWMYVCHITVE